MPSKRSMKLVLNKIKKRRIEDPEFREYRRQLCNNWYNRNKIAVGQNRDDMEKLKDPQFLYELIKKLIHFND